MIITIIFPEIIKVQDELKDLRSKLSSKGADFDIKTLQLSIKRTETELKEKTDSILNNLNSKVSVLPSIEEQEAKAVSYGNHLDTLWDMTGKKSRNQSQASEAVHVEQNALMLRSATVKNQDLEPNFNDTFNEEITPIMKKGFGPTPGQQIKIERETRSLFNPDNARNRLALEENYQISLPLIEKRSAYKMQTHLITGSTIDHLSTLPLVYRRNPTVNYSLFTEVELKKK